MKLDGKVLSTHLGFYDNTIFYYVLPTFDLGPYEKYSPGRVLLQYLLQWSIDHGLFVFDFTVGDESYKFKWCDSKLKLFRISHSNNLLGGVYLFFLNLSLFFKNNRYTRSVITNLVRIYRKYGFFS